MKLLVCAGGTGGGIYPALSIVAALRQLVTMPQEDILWIGTEGEMEEQLVPRSGLNLQTIVGGPIVGVPWLTRINNGRKLAWSILLSTKLIRRFQPDVMLMTGGYMAVPVAIAAWLRKIPIAIFLPDVEPGSAIKVVLPLARKVGCTTEGSRAYIPAEKIVITGYPVRPELRNATHLNQSEALAQFELTATRPTLFVFGGSRGAWNINKTLMHILPQLLNKL